MKPDRDTIDTRGTPSKAAKLLGAVREFEKARDAAERWLAEGHSDMALSLAMLLDEHARAARRQALEEAARVAERVYDDSVEELGPDERVDVGSEIAAALRALAQEEKADG